MVGEAHPWFGPSMTAHTSSDTPAIDSTMPTGSNRCTWVSRLVGTKRAINTMATSTTGTLTMNTDPHQKCSSSQPPVTGPSATLSAGGGGPDRRWPRPVRVVG